MRRRPFRLAQAEHAAFIGRIQQSMCRRRLRGRLKIDEHVATAHEIVALLAGRRRARGDVVPCEANARPKVVVNPICRLAVHHDRFEITSQSAAGSSTVELSG